MLIMGHALVIKPLLPSLQLTTVMLRAFSSKPGSYETEVADAAVMRHDKMVVAFILLRLIVEELTLIAAVIYSQGSTRCSCARVLQH